MTSNHESPGAGAGAGDGADAAGTGTGTTAGTGTAAGAAPGPGPGPASSGGTGSGLGAPAAVAADPPSVSPTPPASPASPSPAAPVDLEELGRAVKEAQYRHHRALDTRLAAVGTTLAQWDALRAIARTPGASAHELAVATFQGDQSFGTLASRLAAQHLIERRPGRGRRIEHHLTEAGERVLTAGRAVAREVLTASFGPLEENERATLIGLLRRIGSPADAL